MEHRKKQPKLIEIQDRVQQPKTQNQTQKLSRLQQIRQIKQSLLESIISNESEHSVVIHNPQSMGDFTSLQTKIKVSQALEDPLEKAKQTYSREGSECGKHKKHTANCE